MSGRVLVPLDGSKLADRILDRVRPLARRGGYGLVLVSVLPEDASEEARRHLQQVQFALRREGLDADYRVRTGDPASAILALADDLQPTVIAMSTHGRTGPARWVMGSVAERVLRGSRHPVFLANPESLGGVPLGVGSRRILVPLDGSERSAEVLACVAPFAADGGAEVVLHYAVPPATVPIGHPMPRVPTLPTGADAAAVLQPFVLRVTGAGITVRTRVDVDTVPANAILDAVRLEAADLVAMTTHGATGLSRWVFGSVAEKVLRACPVPLLLKRTAAFAAAGAAA